MAKPQVIGSRKLITDAPHWHRPDRVKRCIMCEQEKPVSEFYACSYTTAQGKRSTRYESRCRPCAQERRREKYRANPVKDLAASKAWHENNQERVVASRRARQSDPGHRALKARHQRLRKARMRSGQGDDAAIRAIYAEAMRIEALVANCPVFDLQELGHKMHVDHIRPLARGGLHVVSNLQILAAGLNMRKGAKCPQ